MSKNFSDTITHRHKSNQSVFESMNHYLVCFMNVPYRNSNRNKLSNCNSLKVRASSHALQTNYQTKDTFGDQGDDINDCR